VATQSPSGAAGIEAAPDTAIALPEAAGLEQAPRKARPRRVDRSAPGSWVVPDGTGEVLASHPVKAKLASRVYRVPGMPMYERSAPDRCYMTPEAAEADGFTRAAR
jgi:hypothetical protein